MIKTLIVEDNLEYVKNTLNNTLNNTLSKFKDIQIRYIATTVKEAINIIYNNKIDLIFLDLKLPDSSGLEILKKLKTFNYIEKISVIVISGDAILINKANYEYKVNNIINKVEKEEIMYQKIKQSIDEINYMDREKNIKELIKEITNMGYNWKYKGTNYLMEAIIYIYTSNNLDLMDNLEKNVYKYIAYKNNKNVNNIKTNIVKSTERLINSKQSIIDTTTPKQAINVILNKLLINF